MKKLIPVAAALVWTVPFLAFAQTTNIFNLYQTIAQIINGVLVPLVFAVAFLIFIINVVRYFISEGAEGKDEARKLIIYSVIGFAVMIGVWGLVNILLATFNLNQAAPQLPQVPGPR